ncbi:unnamed protein product [Gongylonema pulchrum]|uniref:DUF148 domain-containing protein n=1 Tax=Gongylonema pulchrum TaxID=637853 RepID=A0A183EHY6_9BILA|nr:unnamed protein product [Gongylonema pulchrum]
MRTIGGLLLVLFTCTAFWIASCTPDFIKKLPQKDKEEYESLFEKYKNISRKEFYNLRLKWAQSKGSKVGEMYKQYLEEEFQYLATRFAVLKGRLDKAEGSEAAKNFLYELLALQHNLNISLGDYEEREESMRHEIPQYVLQEATTIWNSLKPMYID